MNILILTHLYPTPEGYGIPPDTKVIHYYAKDFQKMGHRVQVVLMNHWPVKELFRHDLRTLIVREADYEMEGVPVHLFCYQLLTPRKRHPESWQAEIINKRLAALVASLGWKPDRVLVNFPTFCVGVDQIFQLDCPTMGVFHISDVYNLRLDSSRRVRAFLDRFSNWGCRNRQIGQFLSETMGHDAVPIYSGIDESLIAPREQIEGKCERTPDPLRLLYAGKLIARKRAADLVKAVQGLEIPVSLTIVGDGPEMARLRAQAGKDPRICFTGALSREETVARIGEADAFAMVSTGETFGLVYLEAMGQGCIPIASRGEGMDGILEDGVQGFLVQPGEIEQIRSVLRTIYALSQASRRQMILRGYELACSMTSMQMSRRYLDASGEERNGGSSA